MNTKSNTWPVLFHMDKDGRIRTWQVEADEGTIRTYHGLVDGELQVSEKECEGKNLGRSNETNPDQQAMQEAQSLYDKRLRLKYFATIEEAQRPNIRPMLAHKTKPGKVEYPCFVQPKLDGLRCLAFWEGDRVIMKSRGNKVFEHLRHIERVLWEFLPQGCMFDGELYVHGTPFQTLASWIKADHKELTATIQYHIFDMPVVKGDREQQFIERNGALLRELRRLGEGEPIAYVLTVMCNDEAAVQRTHEDFTAMGYEGSIVRNLYGQYEFGQRSWNLLKIKDFEDEEFEIISISDGRGKFEGCAIFRCSDGQVQFDCVMKGTMKSRSENYKNRHELIGKKLTVKFQGRSEDRVPRFPVGLRFAEED